MKLSKAVKPWVLATAAMMMCHAGTASAAYPDKPVRIVVGFAPGGASDTTVRLVAAALQRQLGQTFVVENRPGASGGIAAQAVARNEADGYTLLYATSSSHAIAPHMGSDLGYDAINDFAPIALLSRAGMVLTANKDVPVNSLEEFVAYAKTNAGRVTYASPGHASSQHLSMVMLAAHDGLDFVHVPYKGSAPALNDLVGGQVEFMMDNILASLPFIRDKRIKAIAVTSLERAPLLPEVPTMDEQGMKAFDIQAWGGIVAPAGTPPEVVGTLNEELNRVLQDPSIRETILKGGGVPQGGTASEFKSFIASESNRWKGVIESSKVGE
nr:tripartite tricarboxylate transporter substrate binding protein [Pseudomonas sp.]